MLRFTRFVGLCLVLLGVFAACKKEAQVEPGKAAAALAGAPVVVPPTNTLFAEWPAGVTAVVAIQSLDTLRTTYENAARGFGAPARFDEWLASGQFGSGAFTPATLDGTKPIYMVVFAPLEQPSYAIVAPLKDKAAFETALSAGRQPATGNEFQWQGSGQTVFVNYLGDNVVGTTSAELFAAQRALLDRVVQSLKPASAVQILVGLEQLYRAAKPNLEQARARMLELVADADRFELIPGYGAAARQFYEFYFDALFSLAEQVTLADLRLGADKDRLLMQCLLSVKPGGSISQLIAKGEKSGIASIGLMPPEAYAVVGANLDPSLFKSFRDPAAKFLATMLQSGPEKEKQVADLIDRSYAVQTGDVAYALYASEGFPLSVLAVTLLNDGDGFRSVVEEGGELYLRAVESMVKKGTGGAAPPGIDFSSWENLIEGMGNSAGSFGVKLSVENSSRVKGLDVAIDYEKLPSMMMRGNKSEVDKAVGHRWQFALTFGEKIAAAAFGPEGFRDGEKALKGEFKYENKVFSESMKRAAAHPFFVFWLDLGAGLSAAAGSVESFARLMGSDDAAQLGAQLRAMKSGAPFAFTVGGSATTLHVVADVPFAPIQALRELVD